MAKLLIYESTGIREFELMDEEVQIGRELDNSLRISDPSVSRYHAVLRKTSEGYVIQDKQSSNGVVVNYTRVEEATLADGDQFSLGHVQITFREHDGDSIETVTAPAMPDDPTEAL
ncbi:MAG: FHA domain-containing protein [Holophagales bacterium]|jgi:pSer/pThr/pTyr-binding forkhead associated (FHA) protein|nr:FHA domain-containing protein [Holophagales bacterium]